ncbi:MAG: protein kinase, partial [Planctomycetaceae bacterium]|nr:protein kinase [Planctomycetaceae bacterium]
MIKVFCPNPNCSASYSIADEKVGRIGRCKRCGQKFELVPGTRPGDEPLDPPASEQGQVESLVVDEDEGAPADLPSSFGRYRVIKKLGAGGMGAVYLAHDTQLDRPVALKVPHVTSWSDPEVLERFLREARAAARFHHVNFCPIYDVGQIDGVHFLAMAYIEGRTLAARIDPARPMPPRDAAELVRRLALALAEAHRRGVIHRDLKPSNIMITEQDELVIMDFGLARRFGGDDPELTKSGMILGTPHYMAPEQVKGDRKAMGIGTDIYSLGVILYELLTGLRPFAGNSMEVMLHIMTMEPPP